MFRKKLYNPQAYELLGKFEGHLPSPVFLFNSDEQYPSMLDLLNNKSQLEEYLIKVADQRTEDKNSLKYVDVLSISLLL